MIKVLFVCLGNICRSPLAQGVFEDLVEKAGLNHIISCDSAGTAGYHIGSPPDHRSIKTAKNHAITLEHEGRQLSGNDFLVFDYIISMDKSNFDDVKNLFVRSKSVGNIRLCIMRDFDEPEMKGDNDVPDPYYGNMADFEHVYDIVLRSGKNLLNIIKKEHNL
jgi:protein-tyrosine phosphatase